MGKDAISVPGGCGIRTADNVASGRFVPLYTSALENALSLQIVATRFLLHAVNTCLYYIFQGLFSFPQVHS